MTALPARTGAGGIVDAATTEGQQKANLGDMRDVLAQLFGTNTDPLRTVIEKFRAAGPESIYNIKLVPTVGSSALTVTTQTQAGATPTTADPVLISQRHATVSDGSFNLRAITASNALVISNGSTLGHASAVPSWIYTYQIDNAGTLEPALSSTYFGPSGIITTVGEGGAGAADSATVMYSATLRSNVPFRCTGRMLSTQTTAGVWAAVPTKIEMYPFARSDVPTGAMLDYAGAGAVDPGFLLCDGSNVSRTTYLELFAKIGTTWGVGDGSTTFGLPDSRRRVAVGSGGTGTGTLGNAVGNTGGAETHTLTAAQNGPHSHDLFYSDTGALGNVYAALGSGSTGTTPLITSSGSGTAHNNMQPAYVVQKIIKT